MKALKIILIIVGILVAAMLIVPLFVPATAEVSAGTEIALKPSQIFPAIASFDHREEWDPWVTMDSTATVDIQPAPGYVGSTYRWEGQMIGTGRMEVQSVVENEYIESFLWFGDTKNPAAVEWTFEPADKGTRVTWSYAQETTYPFGRLRMLIGKAFLKKSFENGLKNLKTYLEENPPPLSYLGEITVETREPVTAMTVKGGGIVDSLGQELGKLFGMIVGEIQKQQLQMTGPPFVLYLDFDQETGHINYVAGIPVAEAGKKAGEVEPVMYDEMKVVQAIHTGPYEEFMNSYKKMDDYIKANGLETTGEVLEIYLTDPSSGLDPSEWKTIIAYPLK
jgi:effector-binding domain-containing protein/uncharacterized protein YndB with AHSA1/START domain